MLGAILSGFLSAGVPAALPPYGWASDFDGKLTVDFSGPVVEAMRTELIRKYHIAEDTEASGVFTVEPADYPAFLPKSGELTLVTKAGLRKARVTAVKIAIGASEQHLFLETDLKKVDVALVGAGGKIDPKAALRDVQSAGPDKIREKIYAHALGELSAAEQKKVHAAKITAKGMHLVPGRFAKAAVWLAWINEHGKTDPKMADDDDKDFVHAGLYDGAGSLVETIEKPAYGGDWWSALAVVDVDGDGVDEIIGQPAYYEGASVFLYTWPGGKRVETKINGDGA